MLSRITSRLTYANVMSSLAVFLVLSGGTAVALSGSNTVFSDDITDGNVRNADIGSGAVTNSKLGFRAVSLEKIGPDAINSGRVVNNTLTGLDVLDNQLTGADVTGIGGGDVTDNSLKGADIDESDLGQVPNAANAATLQNFSAVDFPVRVGSGGLSWAQYTLDTGVVGTRYDFGPLELETTSNAGEFKVCGSFSSSITTSFVVYVNGTRTTGTVTGNTCSTAFDAGDEGDFEVSGGKARIFGMAQFNAGNVEDYEVFGFGVP
jgi:hypothetical protein